MAGHRLIQDGKMPAPRRGGGPMAGMINMEKPKDAKKTVLRLIKYIGKSKWLVIAMLVTVLFIVIAGIAAPYLQGAAIDIIDQEAGTEGYVEHLLKTVTLLAVAFLVSSGFTLFQGLIGAKLSQDTVRFMRQDLFSHLTRLPIRYFDSHRHGDIMSRMTNDVETVSNSVSQSLSVIISGVLTIIGVLSVMFILNWQMTLVSFITVPLSFLMTMLMGKIMRKYFKRQQALNGEINGIGEEAITEYHTVVAYGFEEEKVERFTETADELCKTSVKAQLFGGMMGPMMNTLGNINYILIAAVGGFLSVSSGMSLAVIQSFLLYSKQFTRPINELGNQWATIQTAIAGAERIFAVIDTPEEENKGKLKAEIGGDVDFDHIVFSYTKENPVLLDFDLHVKQGERIALVGKTGSGKTTVVNLLTRFYDIIGGKITIGGNDIFDYPKETLRKSIAIVLQDTVLFSDTVKNNIKYGRLDATDEEVINAAKLANADGFIEQLPQGYDTVLSEGGANLSQGQRQLLAIARAIVADPKILILDEATSSVDTTTELKIQQAMLRLMEGRTSFIIAHRLSTIRDVDRIVVLADGKIAEVGNHTELLAKKGVYSKLYHDQFAGIET